MDWNAQFEALAAPVRDVWPEVNEIHPAWFLVRLPEERWTGKLPIVAIDIGPRQADGFGVANDTEIRLVRYYWMDRDSAALPAIWDKMEVLRERLWRGGGLTVGHVQEDPQVITDVDTLLPTRYWFASQRPFIAAALDVMVEMGDSPGTAE